MASNKGYTTATKVRDVMAGRVVAYITDAMIEAAINRAEGAIDNAFGSTITWATGTPKHWVVEGAVTWHAALQISGSSLDSWNTLAELIAFQDLAAYMVKFFMDQIYDDMMGDRILE